MMVVKQSALKPLQCSHCSFLFRQPVLCCAQADPRPGQYVEKVVDSDIMDDVVDKGSVRVPMFKYVDDRFADMDLGGQSGHVG